MLRHYLIIIIIIIIFFLITYSFTKFFKYDLQIKVEQTYFDSHKNYAISSTYLSGLESKGVAASNVLYIVGIVVGKPYFRPFTEENYITIIFRYERSNCERIARRSRRCMCLMNLNRSVRKGQKTSRIKI